MFPLMAYALGVTSASLSASPASVIISFAATSEIPTNVIGKFTPVFDHINVNSAITAGPSYSNVRTIDASVKTTPNIPDIRRGARRNGVRVRHTDVVVVGELAVALVLALQVCKYDTAFEHPI